MPSDDKNEDWIRDAVAAHKKRAAEREARKVFQQSFQALVPQFRSSIESSVRSIVEAYNRHAGRQVLEVENTAGDVVVRWTDQRDLVYCRLSIATPEPARLPVLLRRASSLDEHGKPEYESPQAILFPLEYRPAEGRLSAGELGDDGPTIARRLLTPWLDRL